MSHCNFDVKLNMRPIELSVQGSLLINNQKKQNKPIRKKAISSDITIQQSGSFLKNEFT